MWNKLVATSTPHMLLAPLGVFHKLLMVSSSWMQLFVPSAVTLQNLSYPSKLRQAGMLHFYALLLFLMGVFSPGFL